MALKRIVILGAGGQAREIEWAIREINRRKPSYEFIGYAVRDLSELSAFDSKERLLGDDAWLVSNADRFDCFAIGNGSPERRLHLADTYSKRFPEVEWPALIHPTATYDVETCRVGAGCFISANAVITVNVQIGPFSLINFGCTIGHEASVGRGCVVNPGGNISGGVVLEDGSLVGTGAQVLQYLRIGANARIGAGAVVTKNVPANQTVIGVPAASRAKR